MTCAILQALVDRGMRPVAFKCGPDYIDPMFHSEIIGAKSRNLDLFFLGADTTCRLLAENTAGSSLAVVEGVMGYYDGIGMSSDAGAYDLARTTGTPAILVADARGRALSAAALVKGLAEFRPDSGLRGVILNRCSPMLYPRLKACVEEEVGIPVFGYLPLMSECALESRHLGLKTAGEITDLAQKIGLLADALEANLDWATLEALTERPAPAPVPPPALQTAGVRIAVAQDKAFCFAYAETLDCLRTAGAELVFFSPVHDTALPEDICGLYLPGGYPELYALPLSENKTMRDAIRDAVNGGLPTVAECGGFLYLGQTLEDASGTAWPMAGVLPGKGVKVGRLVRFGYADMTAKADSLLFHAGEHLYIHEFHHWDSTDNGSGFSVWKSEKAQWECGFASMSLYAGFPHLYWAGTPLPRRFVSGAKFYQRQKRNTHD